MGSQWALHFNFSNITSGDLEAFYYSGGVLVATAPALGPSGTLLMQQNAAISWSGTDAKECSNCLKSVVITASKAIQFTDFFGNEILADTVDVVASSFDAPFDGFDTGVLLTASGISTLTINNEVFTVATPEPTSFLLLCSGLIGLAALARSRRRWKAPAQGPSTRRSESD
jgi:hypothetical protein